MMAVTVIAVGDTEAAVIDELAQKQGRLRIVRRCPELAELLAACQSGVAQVAVVARFTEDLTATLIDRLTAVGVSVVAVADSPEEARRLRGIGATVVTAHVTTLLLTDVVCEAIEGRRHPSVSGYAVPTAGTDFQLGTPAIADDAGASWPSGKGSASDGADNDGANGSVASSDSKGVGRPAAKNSAASSHAAGVPRPSTRTTADLGAPKNVQTPVKHDRAVPHGGWGMKIADSLRFGKAKGKSRSNRVHDVSSGKGTTRIQSRDDARASDSSGGGPTTPGSIVAVWGPIGAPGKTTMAINLAAEHAAAGRQVMLIDADSYGASIAASLGLLDESASFAQACRAADQGALTLAALAKITTKLVFSQGSFSLLTGLTRADRWPELRAAAVERVLRLAREMAELVVVDCGFALESDEELSYDTVAPRRNAANLAVLSQADLIYAVGNSDPVGIPRLIKGLGELAQVCPSAEVCVVANKVRRKAVGGSPEKALAQAWDRFGPVQKISHFLPWDPELTDKALLEGRLLMEVAPDAPLRRAIQEITCAADQQKLKGAVVKATAKLEVQG
ncbi:hypothetical protein [Arthrobacter sp.]|uniref:AAA family ATPase n=1 Tax=Arthrobacter sp. TaxID=1667 RepID=UPI0026E0CD98|nr:hypothetical protein [Arthrobacter sp.]MDO5751438.1 hypothetical protein [Arthrobacter sp.]